MTAVVVHRTVQSSELSRNSAAVFAAAEQGPVNITRRDGEGFVLARSEDVEQERRALRLAADLVAASLSQTGQPLAERLRQQFPWVEFLAGEDREQFATEIVDVTRACAAVGHFGRLLVAFEAWRSTAEAIAAGYTPDAELDWLDVPVTVDDPRQGG
jgi:PHD/YefM family antitoxin component YafN of YafNO toxin-antitoxin module